MFVERPAVGRCEVVCFTAEHDSSFSALTPERARTVIEAWVDRTLALSALPQVEQVFCFENRGEEIGVTLAHPHGQIYAYPFVTPRTRRMLDVARRHRERSWRNLFDDILAAELRSGDRIVTRGDCWTAFVPYAARWPLEVHLYPNRRVGGLPDLTDTERDDLARVYLDILRRMEAVYDDTLPYIAAWHQAPVRVDRDLASLHLQVFSIRRAPGKLKYLAGSESAMGAFINDVSPEHAARMLREADR
jgi:UDPglucose--hexose-1-phosphate uridylyltransferase